MGVLVGISKTAFGSAETKYSAIKREILISTVDSGLTRVTLWGDAARQIRDEFLQDTDKYIVLIITSTIVEKLNGTYCLSSTMATKVYVDLPIPQVEQMRKR
ncbi:hypothetical protein MKW92_017596 [Papaver armeniacum]|nr:hypothetical protein MKW92_017596 [Papaver armeniacum]